MKEHLLTTEEIAEYLRVEVVTVRRLVARGDLPAYRIGGEFRFMIPDVEAFVKSQRVGGGSIGSGEKEQFTKFTERMHRVIILADDEAARLQHHYIGTEHLLLGLVREGEGIAAKVLTRAGVDFQDVNQRVADILERGQQRAAASPPGRVKAALREVLGINRTADLSDERGFTERALKVLRLAADESRRLYHQYIGTEHLLIALVREGEGIAAQVLVEGYSLNLARVRSLLMEVFTEEREDAASTVSEKAATLLAEGEQGIQCSKCGARSPDYFQYCFHCGLKFSA